LGQLIFTLPLTWLSLSTDINSLYNIFYRLLWSVSFSIHYGTFTRPVCQSVFAVHFCSAFLKYVFEVRFCSAFLQFFPECEFQVRIVISGRGNLADCKNALWNRTCKWTL